MTKETLTENRTSSKTNLILIGMPGVGKSTIGALLAKQTGWHFLDTDKLIEKELQLPLQSVVDTLGLQKFLQTEAHIILTLNQVQHVISTGGSVIYEKAAMSHLKRLGIVIYLALSFEALIKRNNNYTDRGLAIPEGYTLAQLYNERIPLYEKYADVTIPCQGQSAEEITQMTLRTVGFEE